MKNNTEMKKKNATEKYKKKLQKNEKTFCLFLFSFYFFLDFIFLNKLGPNDQPGHPILNPLIISYNL